jgi:hypothetical protein
MQRERLSSAKAARPLPTARSLAKHVRARKGEAQPAAIAPHWKRSVRRVRPVGELPHEKLQEPEHDIEHSEEEPRWHDEQPEATFSKTRLPAKQEWSAQRKRASITVQPSRKSKRPAAAKKTSRKKG